MNAFVVQEVADHCPLPHGFRQGGIAVQRADQSPQFRFG